MAKIGASVQESGCGSAASRWPPRGSREGKNPGRPGLGDFGADNDFPFLAVKIIGHELQGFPRTNACINLKEQETVITESGVCVFVRLLEKGMNFFFLKLDDPPARLALLQSVQGGDGHHGISLPRL